jgi:ribosomal protein L13E
VASLASLVLGKAKVYGEEKWNLGACRATRGVALADADALGEVLPERKFGIRIDTKRSKSTTPVMLF